MRVIALPKFDEAYANLPNKIKRKVDKQITFPLRDFRYPSLHAKKYDEANDIWQARIDRSYRFYFKIEGDSYLLIELDKHAG